MNIDKLLKTHIHQTWGQAHILDYYGSREVTIQGIYIGSYSIHNDCITFQLTGSEPLTVNISNPNTDFDQILKEWINKAKRMKKTWYNKIPPETWS